jgi:hypothetical protein
MYPDSEILFPHRSVADLKDLRNEEWRALVERIAKLSEIEKESLAFSLMMIRTCECLKCDLGSYKASLGCTACAQRAIGSSKETDEGLLEKFAQACQDIDNYLENRPVDLTDLDYPDEDREEVHAEQAE